MIEFSHPLQDPSSTVMDVLELLNALTRIHGEKLVAIVQPGGDKGMDQLFCVCQMTHLSLNLSDFMLIIIRTITNEPRRQKSLK